MPQVTLTMSAENAARINAANQGLWPIPQIPDPNFVGNPEDAPLVDEFTAVQWGKILLIRYLAKTVRRWENKVAMVEATVLEDPNIAT